MSLHCNLSPAMKICRHMRSSTCMLCLLIEKQSGDQDVKLLRNARKGVGIGGSMSDDEPLYDSVCSDEDYASIGDNQSVKDETNADRTQVLSSKETADTVVLLLESFSP